MKKLDDVGVKGAFAPSDKGGQQMEQIRIYVLDREEIVLYAMSTLCSCLQKEIQMTGKHTDLKKGIEEIRELEPEAVFLDSRLYLQQKEWIRQLFSGSFAHITLVLMISTDLAKEQETQIREQYPLLLEKASVNEENLRMLVGQIRSERRNPSEEMLMKHIMNYIQEHYLEDLTLACLAEKFHYSYPYLSAAFRNYTGQNFAEYLNQIRLKQACEMLETSQASVSAIADMTGYSSHGYFSKAFKKYMGCSPKRYRDTKSKHVVQKRT